MTIRLCALLMCLLSLPSRAEEPGSGDSVGDIAAGLAAKPPEERQQIDDALKKVQEQKRVKSDQQQPGEKGAGSTANPEDVQSMLSRIPEGPPSLGDLRQALAIERSQIVEDNIQEYIERKTDHAIGELVRTFLRMVYYDGNNSTDMGPYIKKALETPDGWQILPYSHYVPLPDNIAGMCTVNTFGAGDLMIDPVKGNTPVVYSHEMYHNIGHPDMGPNGAYALMGKEFGGGGIGSADITAARSRSGKDFQAKQCSN